MILFVNQFSRKHSRCDRHSNGKERREWTHVSTIVGRAYFLARFSCSHLPLAEKHFSIYKSVDSNFGEF